MERSQIPLPSLCCSAERRNPAISEQNGRTLIADKKRTRFVPNLFISTLTLFYSVLFLYII
jgi:hypothetical protein